MIDFARSEHVELVSKFRYAIDAAKANHENRDYFRRFPAGQCGTTSDMLAQYLIDNGYTHVIYVNGTCYNGNSYNGQSHTWLEVGGLVIDITGDQFKYYENSLKYDIPIYIGPMNPYYQQFEVHLSGRHPHNGLERSWSNYHDLVDCYDIILQYIKKLASY